MRVRCARKGFFSYSSVASDQEPSRCVTFSDSPSGPPWDSGHRPRVRH